MSNYIKEDKASEDNSFYLDKERDLDKKIKELKMLKNDRYDEFINKFNEISLQLKDYENPYKEYETYKRVGEFYRDNKEFTESYIYYMRALNQSSKLSDITKTVNMITEMAVCEIYRKNYKQAISLNDHALTLIERYNIEGEKSHKKAIFNKALAYIKLKMYNECLEELDKFEKSFHDISPEVMMNILTIRGNSHMKMNRIFIAKKIYDEIIQMAKQEGNNEILAISYVNLSNILKENDNLVKAIEYDTKALNLVRNSNSGFKGQILYNLGEKLLLNNKIFEAEEHLIDGINIAKENKDYNLYIDIVIKLIRGYIDNNLDKKIINILWKVEEDLDSNILSNIKDKIQIPFMEGAYYFIDKDPDLGKNILKKGLYISEHIK